MGPNGQDRGRNRSLAIIAWLTPTKLNSPPMSRPEIAAAKHLVKTSAQTSAKATDLAVRLELRIRCGKELQHLPFFQLAACDLRWLRSARWFFRIRVSQERRRAGHLEWEWNVSSLQLSP